MKRNQPLDFIDYFLLNWEQKENAKDEAMLVKFDLVYLIFSFFQIRRYRASLCLVLFFSFFCLKPQMAQAQQTEKTVLVNKEKKSSTIEKATTKEDDEEMYEKLEHANEKNEYAQAHSSWYKQMVKAKPNLTKAERAFSNYFRKHPHEDSKLKDRFETWKNSAGLYKNKKGYSITYPQMKGNFAAPAAPLVSLNKTFGSWTMIGPANMVNSECSNSSVVSGGYVDRVYVNPYNTQNLFAGFAYGGLWVSKDQGTSWQLTDGSFANGTNTYASRDYYYGEIEAHKLNSNLVFAATEAGLLKSTDGGINWALAPQLNRSVSSTTRPYYVSLAADDQNIVLSTFGRRVYRSADGGTTWSPVFDNSSGGSNHIVSGYNLNTPFGLNDRSYNFFGLEANMNDSNVFYLGVWNSSNQACIYKSTDKGLTFTLLVNLNATLATTWGTSTSLRLKTVDASDNFMVYEVFSAGKPIYKFSSAGTLLSSPTITGVTDPTPEAFEIDWKNENTMYQGKYGVYNATSGFQKSIDGGATFAPPFGAGCNYIHSDIRGVSAVGNIVLIGNDGGLAISTDGGLSVKGTGFEINSMDMWGFSSSTKSDICLTGLDHNQTFVRSFSADGGWKKIKGADAGVCSINPYNDRWLYFDWAYGVNRGYLNDNQTVTEYPVAAGVDLGSLQFDPNSAFIIYGISKSNRNTIVKSTDNMISAALLFDFGETVNAIRVSRKDTNVMYVLLSNNKIKKTIDGGTTWTLVTPSSTQSSGQTNITAIEVGKTSDELWVAYGNAQNTAKVLYSIDGGSNWTNITTNNLPAAAVNDIVYQRGTDGGVYIITITSTGTKIWYKNNAMATWQQTGDVLPIMGYIKGRLYVVPAKNKIRFGSSRGAWENDLYETSSVEASFAAEATTTNCSNGPIQFYDASATGSGAVTYAWEFPGGTPSTSSLENPKVSYGMTGVYPVTLTITTAAGSDTKTLNNFITVECTSSIQTGAVTSIEDAYVRDGGSASTNFGTVNTLAVKKDGAGYSRETYLKFDLNSLPSTADKVSLQLNIATANTTVSGTTWELYYVPVDSWTETGLTWNNKPAPSTLLATTTGKGSGTAEWDITPQALSELGGDKILSLKIVSTTVGGTTDVNFRSKEEANASLRPQIITNIVNKLPGVSITSPANNAVVTAGSNVTISANAYDNDGTVSKVEFYQGNTLLGESTTAPYSFTWNNPAAGSYVITAKVTDNFGSIITSTDLNVIVDALPTVSITSPANNTIVTAGSNITINANAADADGTVSKVEFYQGSTLLGQSAIAPYSYIWNNPATGSYVLTAKAIDNNNAVTTSTVVNVVVNALPTVSITSPANNATFTTSQSITISADASDSDGTISKVEFYQGSTLLGQSTSSPYTFTWNNPVAGSYAFTSKATDNLNGVTTSSVVNITVTPPPLTTTPIADAYIRDGSYASNNYGTSTSLEVKKDGSSYSRESYLRFDYSTFTGSTVSNVKLRVYVSYVNTDPSRVVSVYGIANTTWGETTINWNNKPAETGTLLGSYTINNVSGVWYELDVTTYINNQLALGNKIVSFRLVNLGGANSTNNVIFNSREVSSNKPELVLTYGSSSGRIKTDGAMKTSIDESTDFKVIVSPNPSTSEFKVQVKSSRDEELQIKVYNVNHQLINELKKSVGETFTFGSNLPAGIYLIEVKQGLERKIVKVVKL